ncbi:putative ribonuclease H-like domain-containing protein [Tanacetum coccineum]
MSGTVKQVYEPTTIKEKQDRRNEMKAKATLLMALPNKDQLKFHSYQDVKLLLDGIEKRYRWERELEGSSSTSQNSQNVAFVSNSTKNTNSTNKADNNAYEVSTTHTQGNGVNLDNLCDVVIVAFLASQPNSPQIAQEDLEQLHPNDLEEMDLQWEMAMLIIRARRFMKRTWRKLDINGQSVGFDKSKVECYNCHKHGHFTRECRFLRNQENKGRENNTRTIAVETPTQNALVAQDEIGRYDWSYQAKEEQPTNHALMAFTSSGSSSSSDSEVDSCSKTCEKAYATLKEQYDREYGSKTWLRAGVVLAGEMFFTSSRCDREKVEDDYGNVWSGKLSTASAAVNTVRPVNTANTKAVNTIKSVNTAASKPIGNPQQKEYKEKGVIDCGYSRHMTGNKCYLDEYEDYDGGFVSFGDGKGRISGKMCHKSVTKKNNVLFTDTECLVLSSNFKLLDESQVLLRVPRKDNIYSVDLKSVVPTGGLTCLIAKAIIDESNTWHMRLGHINFKTMNKLVKGNLVKGFPLKIYENDHTCVACQKGKQHKASYKTKLVNSISKPLHMLHMDLFGLTNVKSLMKKSYCLVVTDDFSRFSWVFFFATKDETSGILKAFITKIENQLDHKVKLIRSDNRTEFKNSIMNQFCEMNGIKREFSVAMTPQQNGVAERKNKTLIEAAKTMLVDSKLPTTFWAEAVNTACYLLNRVLVIKPHNKTPYELIRGRPPLIDFMKPFGCPVTILNTRDHLGKFDGKTDEGYFVRYSVVSKAMKVFNKRTRIVEETLNIRFLENTPNVKRNGPDWFFDVDSLSISMNYVPVVAGNKTNGIARIKDNTVAGQAQKEKQPEQEYILILICTTDPSISQGPKDRENDTSMKPTEVINTARPPGSTSNAFEEHLFKRFSHFKNAFSLPPVLNISSMDNIGIFGNAYDDEDVEEVVDMNNVNSSYLVPDTSFTKFHKDHPEDQDFSKDSKHSNGDKTKALIKDEEAEDVDVYLYRSMIGSLMYLTASRLDIMFVVYACARFQFTPKISQFNDQTIVANSTTEAEYVAAANCCGQVGDEAVHKELGDRMERAATTASSFEAEQDSGSGPRALMNVPTYVSLIEHFGKLLCFVPNEDGVMLSLLPLMEETKIIIKASIRRHPQLLRSESVVAVEEDLKQTKKVYSSALTKLVLKVKKLEKQDGGTSWFQEDPEKTSTDTEILVEQETLTELIENLRSGEKVTTASASISIASPPKVSTAEVSTASPDVGTAAAALVFKRRKQAKAMAEQEQERINFEAALELPKQLNEREEVPTKATQSQTID